MAENTMVTRAQMEEYYSTEGRKRQMAGLRKLVTAFASQPGIICLHGGFPPAHTFPVKKMTLTLDDGQTVVIDDPAKLAAAQQYCMVTAGYGPLHAWARAHTWRMHAPPGDHDLIITPGNNQTIEVVFRLLLDRGEGVLCEEYTYPHIAESLVMPQGSEAVPLCMDAHGIVPSLFRRTLEDLRAAGRKLPRLLYTVPVGQNPTGSITPPERKREIYGICRQHGILILEDDPYYYLQFPAGGGEPQGLANLGASYLSMDTDGRVIRLDSFSKVLAPGLRIGWVTAPPAIMEKIIYHMQGIQLGPNSFTQVAIAEILEAWGEGGFEAHVRDMQREYCLRAATIQAAAVEHLTGLAEWQAPAAGMFLWLRLAGVRDADDILDALRDAGVVIVPGRFCHCCGPAYEAECPLVRVSFASGTPWEMREGMARLGRVLRAAAAAAKSGSSGLVEAPARAEAPSSAPATTAKAAAAAAGLQGTGPRDSAFERQLQQQQNGLRRRDGPPKTLENPARSVAARCASLERRSDSAMSAAMASMRVGPPPAEPDQAPAAPEVVPGCQARIDLIRGSPALTSDPLAPKAAKTIIAPVAQERCHG